MEKEYSYDQLLKVVEYWADELGTSTIDLIAQTLDILDKREKENKISDIMEQYKSLDPVSQKTFLDKISKKDKSENLSTRQENLKSISYLSGLSQEDMTYTNPIAIHIDNIRFMARGWSDVSINFVKFLIDNHFLSVSDLPFFVNPSTSKVWINNKNYHDNGKDGKFNKVCDGVWVDIKYNSLYHVLNIRRALEKLHLFDLLDKIKIEFTGNKIP